MRNLEISKIFFDIADILEMKNVQWKPIAYRKAARAIESLSEDIQVIYKKGGEDALKEIPSVGEGIAKKIIEYLKTGKIHDYEKLRKSIPAGVLEIMSIQGMGPKKAWKLYKKLKIYSLKKLEQSAREGRIRKLEGFGEKSEQDILAGLELVKKGQERMLLGTALPIARNIVEKLKRLKEIEEIYVAGSIRRMKETVRDIDILVISKDPQKVMDFFTSLDDVKRILAKGETKSSVVLKEGLNCDVRVLDERSYGAGLMYFTGSKDHNVTLRGLAIKKGLKLSEYGLFKGNRFVAGGTEEEVYHKLGMDYIGPEMRENIGEIDVAIKRKLPKLIPYDSIKGDLHVHTIWTDGHYSTEDMIKAAINMGYEYVAITDHSKSEYVARGLNEKKLLQHLKEIESLAKKYGSKIAVLTGSEVDILPDGSLDYSDEILKKLDVVVASVHSRFKMSKEEMTKRIVKAVSNGNVTILGHPSGRLIHERNPYEFDLDKVLQACKDNCVLVEINAHPPRLDLKDVHIRRAVELGVKMVINTDSHSTEHLRYMEFGIAQARRGWATAKDVVNTLRLKEFRKFIN